MNVNLETHKPSTAIERVENALRIHAPKSVHWTELNESDLVIMHVTGRNIHRIMEAREYQKQGKSYAVIQYSMKSTRNPNPQDWMPLWNGAKAVWSYYDLPTPNLYRSPLAADPGIFFTQECEKKYTVGTLGDYFQAECIGEVHLAVWQTYGKAVHIGKPFDRSPVVDYFADVDNDRMRGIYNSCERFASLRRKEGFEMPAVESLLCGVRPILFDTPDYRQWFDGLAEFIPESGIPETVASLKKMFKKSPRPVTDAEIEETKTRFNWERIVAGFWERCS